jgi:hypothetical protein
MELMLVVLVCAVRKVSENDVDLKKIIQRKCRQAYDNHINSMFGEDEATPNYKKFFNFIKSTKCERTNVASLRNLAGMSSGPVALLGIRCWRRFCTPFVLMVILFISGVGLILYINKITKRHQQNC